MSLAKINYEYSKMVSGLISLQFDPYDPTHILTSEMESFCLERLMDKLNKLLVSKILSHDFVSP